MTPPTPQPPGQEQGKLPDPLVPFLPEDDSITSPTASILESMETESSEGDAAVASGASALKRASSGEVTRSMRGPRGRSPLLNGSDSG